MNRLVNFIFLNVKENSGRLSFQRKLTWQCEPAFNSSARRLMKLCSCAGGKVFSLVNRLYEFKGFIPLEILTAFFYRVNIFTFWDELLPKIIPYSMIKWKW